MVGKKKDKIKPFTVKLESVDPIGVTLKSSELSMMIIDESESMIKERLFIHIGECLYRIDKTGLIIERIIPHE